MTVRYRRFTPFALALVLALVLVAMLVPTRPVAAQETNDELVELVVGLLRETDKDVRSLAFEQIRSEAPGERATQQFAAQLPKLAPDAQVGLVNALADRGDRAAHAAVVVLLEATNDQDVKVAAIRSLGALGQATDCPRLVELLVRDRPDVKQAARDALVRLSGSDMSTALLAELKRSSSAVQVQLIEILAERRALETIPDLLKLAVSQDDQVRGAAMAALGQIARPDDLPGMIRGVLKADRGSERVAAEKNVMFVCNRIANKDQRATPLLAAMKALKSSDRRILLSTLGRVGGPAALIEVNQAVASRDPSRHAAGLTALANWPDASAAPPLIRLSKTDRHAAHRITAVRALVRIAPLPDGRTDAQKLKLLTTAMQMTTRDRDRLLALKRASAIRIPEALRFVLPYTDQPKFAQQACETIVELAHHRTLRDANKDEFHRALDKVIATSDNATVVDRAHRYKNNQTWVRPK